MRELLSSGSDKKAGLAAYVLSHGAKPRIRSLFWIASSVYAANGVSVCRSLPLPTGQPAGAARQSELELMSALVGYELRTKIDADCRHDLGQRCMTDMCRSHAR